MTLTETELHAMLNEHRPEGLYLEFKRGDALSRNDASRRELIKDITGFANGDGGLILYGVAEDRVGDIYAASGLAPVADPLIRREWIAEVLRSGTSPPLTNLQITELEVDGGRVIAVHVEPSFTAHQSLFDHKYYQRGAVSTAPMVDFQIRDVMARRSRPEAKVTPSFPALERRSGLHRYALQIAIENIGHVSIHNWWLEVDLPAACVRDSRPGYPMNQDPRFPHLVRSMMGFFRVGCGDPGINSGRRLVIHPGQAILLDSAHPDFCIICLEVDDAIFNRFNGWPGGSIEWRLYCEGSPPRSGSILFEDWTNF